MRTLFLGGVSVIALTVASSVTASARGRGHPPPPGGCIAATSPSCVLAAGAANASAIAAGVTGSLDPSAVTGGRLGFTETNLLPYVTGGLALTNFRMADSYTANGGALGAFGGGSSSDQRTGWTIGGGLEWAVNDHWSIKASTCSSTWAVLRLRALPASPAIPTALAPPRI
jgi:hypothetical protein